MQIQSKTNLSQAAEARRARQAALTQDDAFAGGTAPMARRGVLPRRPWHAALDHLWDRRTGSSS